MLKQEICFKKMLTFDMTGVKTVTLHFKKIKLLFWILSIRIYLTYLKSKVYR